MGNSSLVTATWIYCLSSRSKILYLVLCFLMSWDSSISASISESVICHFTREVSSSIREMRASLAVFEKYERKRARIFFALPMYSIFPLLPVKKYTPGFCGDFSGNFEIIDNRLSQNWKK